MDFALVAPKDPKEAFDLLAAGSEGDAVAIAGGTDLLLDLDDGRTNPKRVVSLRRLPWSFRTWRDRELTVGSTLPLSELEADPRVRRELPGLFDALGAVGSVALRHRATLGGNVGRAAPASDLLPVLLALDARVNVLGPGGARTTPLDRFLVGSRQTTLARGELIHSVTIPEASPCAYVWQRVRPANDISQVGVAAAAPTGRGGWRVALGGLPPRAIRLPESEGALTARHPSDLEIEFAAQQASEHAPFVTDKRATEAYRRRLVATLVRQAVRRADLLPPPVRAVRRRPR
ncbi:MAG: FAD binding domain-containing protein [Thermoplasmata archaeon]